MRQDPIQIKVIERDEGRSVFKASLPVESVLNPSGKVDEWLSNIEKKYTQTIYECRKILRKPKSRKRIDPEVYWRVGDLILKFMKDLERTPFYLCRKYAFFARDLGLSETSIYKIVRFRKKYPDKRLIDPALPWNLYREGKI